MRAQLPNSPTHLLKNTELCPVAENPVEIKTHAYSAEVRLLILGFSSGDASATLTACLGQSQAALTTHQSQKHGLESYFHSQSSSKHPPLQLITASLP